MELIHLAFIGQSVQRTASKPKLSFNTMGDSRGGHHKSASERGRVRGTYSATRDRSASLIQNSRQPAPKLRGGTSTRVVQTRGRGGSSPGRVRATPPASSGKGLQPTSAAPEANGSAYPSPADTAKESLEPSARSSSQFKTYEEWYADKTHRQRKQQEEEAAKLMDENEKAMQVDLPCEVESLSSRSISTEPVSEYNAFPRVLEPIRKTPSSVVSSSATSFVKPSRLSNSLPTMTDVLEPIKIVRTDSAEAKDLSPISFSSEHEEREGLIPGFPTSSGFQAPDWRAARGKSKPSHTS